MKWFTNLKTMAKLMLGFLLVSAIMAGVGYMGVSSMGTINGMLDALYTRDLVGLSQIKEANLNLVYVNRAVRQAVLSSDEREVAGLTQDLDRYAATFDDQLAKSEALLVTAEGKAKLAEVKDGFAKYLSAASQVMTLAAANKDAEALETMRQAKAVSDSVDNAMTALAQTKERLGKQAYEESNAVYARARNVMVALIVAGVLIGIATGFFIARMISIPLAGAVSVLNAVAEGDYTKSLDHDSRDEVGVMAKAVNSAVGQIRTALQQVTQVLTAMGDGDFTRRLDQSMKGEIGQMAMAVNRAVEEVTGAFREVRDVADMVASASQQLSSGSQEISSGAQEQASSLEETAASLEEITSTVKQNADNAQQASQLASASRDVAEKGGRVVSDAVEAMGEINQSSKKIAEIITAIDEIAFQTNLLALNAAVEAARAGEQGRGFAVVAAEVRNLAQRSATAAKEIKGLIQDSVRKVESGSELVNRSGATLEQIVGSVKRVTDIVGEIAAASREQTSGIEQVNKAMTQMDQVTQANASQTEELSSTAESLSGQAEQLQELVARFKLEQDGATRGAGRARRPAAAAAVPDAKAIIRKPGVKRPVSDRVVAGDMPAARAATVASAASGAKGADAAFEEF